MERLNNKVEVYVPTADGAGRNLAADAIADALEAVQVALTLECGGSTTYPATGTYLNNAGAIVRESVNIVSAFVSDDGLDRVAFIARHMAGELAATLRQECVAVEVAGSLEFVEASASAGAPLAKLAVEVAA